MYIVQQQALGSTQWTTIASSLKDTSYTVTSLSRRVCYSFRVISTTGKASSKPSQPTDLVQLIDRGIKKMCAWILSVFTEEKCGDICYFLMTYMFILSLMAHVSSAVLQFIAAALLHYKSTQQATANSDKPFYLWNTGCGIAWWIHIACRLVEIIYLFFISQDSIYTKLQSFWTSLILCMSLRTSLSPSQ